MTPRFAGSRGVRVRTLVFGLVMLTTSVSTLIALLTRVHVDAGAVALAVVAGAGALLFAGGLTAAVREMRRSRPGA